MSIDDKFEEEPREIIDVCRENVETGGFSMELVGNTYCSLALGKRVECPYLAKEQDHNELYPCLNPLYQSAQREDVYKYN